MDQVFIECVATLLLVVFWLFDLEVCGISASQLRIKLIPPTSEGEVLNPWTTREVPSEFLFYKKLCLPLKVVTKCNLFSAENVNKRRKLGNYFQVWIPHKEEIWVQVSFKEEDVRGTVKTAESEGRGHHTCDGQR